MAAPQSASVVKVAGGRGTADPTAAPAVQVGLMEGITWPQPGEDKFWERAPRSAPAPPLMGSSSSAAPPARDADPMHLVHVTAEMAPIAKVRPGHPATDGGGSRLKAYRWYDHKCGILV